MDHDFIEEKPPVKPSSIYTGVLYGFPVSCLILMAAPSAGCRLDGSNEALRWKPEKLLFSFDDSGEGLEVRALSVSCCRLRLDEDFELVLECGPGKR